MIEQAQQLVMPSQSTMVEEAIARMDTLGLRSQIVDLDTKTLHGLGMRLTDRGVTVADAHRWLNDELGGDDENQVVDDNAVYRFSKHLRRIYSQIRREYANRIARLTVDHATDTNIKDMTRVAQLRLVELTAEKLVDADSFDDVGKAMSAAMFAVKFGQDAQRADEDLERKQRETDAKLELAAQREAKLEKENESLQIKLDAQRKELQRSIESAKKDVQTSVESGSKAMDADDVIAILDKVMKGEA